MSSSAAIVITVYTSENYSSDRIWNALVQVLQSAYSSLAFDIKRYGKHGHNVIIKQGSELHKFSVS